MGSNPRPLVIVPPRIVARGIVLPVAALLPLAAFAASLPAAAVDRTVGPGGMHATLGEGLAAAAAGDVLIVAAGTYEESIVTTVDDLTVRATDGAVVIVTSTGRVLDVQHAGLRIEGIVIDGQYGDSDAIRVRADRFAMDGVEVRRSGRDCIDMGSVADVVIARSSIHHCLQSTAPSCAADTCRVDAHGIVGNAVRNLRIIDTEIHTFSGDAVQLDPDRLDPGWRDVVIEGCTFWLEPLPEAEGGFAAGVVPGENALDTKTAPTITEPATLTIRDTVARGFGGGLISNMAAFNLKENVAVTLDGVTVSDSEIAFRIRGATGSAPRGAQSLIMNAIVYDVQTAVRYEDDLGTTRLYNLTFGRDVTEPFDRAGASMDALDVRNVLVLGDALPPEASAASNLLATAADFDEASAHDYRLVPGASAIDAGEALVEVVQDRAGTPRPAGEAYDVGAFETCEGADCRTPPVDDGGTPSGEDGGSASRDGSITTHRDGSPPGPTATDDSGCACHTACHTAAPMPVTSAAPLCIALALIARRRRRHVRHD